MPIYTVTCRPTPDADPEELFIDAISAGQARAHAIALDRRVEKVSITRRGQIVGDVIVLAVGDYADDNGDKPPSCGGCGYALEGLPLRGRAVHCPECGQATRIAVHGPAAAVIRSTKWDVSRWGAANQGPPQPGRAAGGIAVVVAIIGLAQIGPALLAIALGCYALELSNRRYGITGIVLGIIATLLRIGAALT